MRSSWTRLAAALVALLTAAVIVGCGSSNSSSSTTTSSSAAAPSSTSSTPAASSGGNPTVTALVPAALKSKGTLTVAADASYAPNEFIASDGHTVIGMDADLMKAIATAMGLKIKVVNATFDSIIPGLASGKYDVGASSFTDTKEREKTVDFVDYLTAGESFYTKASGGTEISTIADLCGHTVAVERGTTEQADANTQSKKCKAAGKPAVTVLPFADQNGANLALVSGRAQLGFADSPPAEYQVKKSNGQFKLVGQSYASAPYGLAVPKNSGLAKPIQAAVLALMKDGQYKAILTHWGVQAGAIPASQVKINGAIS
ncbi:MAG TPA: ABC transporter substrate-binding protein [Solirubrobacteraceae bacterium]|nr:ABC transporter substrate-binding protein [Solirubrobacteraceae bacterium]